jgi:hypothetical protein
MNQKQKKPYEPPKIYRVELNQEQAILASCLAGATSLSNGAGGTGCSAACRRQTATGGDSAQSSS